MSLAKCARLLWRSLWLIVLWTTIDASAAYIISRQMTPVYQASATMLVNPSPSSSSTVGLDALRAGQSLATTYALLLHSRPVLEEAIADLGLPVTPDQLDMNLDAVPIRDTQLITLSVRDTDPRRAEATATDLISIFERRSWNLQARSFDVVVVAPAYADPIPVSPRIWLNTLLGAIIGMLIPAGLVLLSGYLDDSVRSKDEVERLVGLPTLAAVPEPEAADRTVELTMDRDWQSALARAYDQLRARIEYATRDHPPGTIAVTGSGPAEPRSFAAANLAAAFAKSGKRVILIDADSRSVVLDRLFPRTGTPGLAELLRAEGYDNVDAYLASTGVENLRFIPSGRPASGRSESLDPRRIARLIGALRASADLLLFSGPSLVGTSEGLVLAQACDATLLVVTVGSTRAGNLRVARDSLRRSGAHVLGVALSGVRQTSDHVAN